VILTRTMALGTGTFNQEGREDDLFNMCLRDLGWGRWVFANQSAGRVPRGGDAILGSLWGN